MADCSKTVDFLREWGRMCNSGVCFGCGIGQAKEATAGCRRYVMTHPEDAIAIVQRWSVEHPALTWAGKLNELLPNAKIEDIINMLCPRDVFGDKAPDTDTTCNMSCGECWSTEYKEGPTNGDQQQGQRQTL